MACRWSWINGQIASKGAYPAREELARLAGIAVETSAPSLYTDAVAEPDCLWLRTVAENTTRTSCLGPLAGFETEEALHDSSLQALTEASATTLALVKRIRRPRLCDDRKRMAAMLTVVAGMKAKPGKEEDLRRAVLALIEPTRREDGCAQYDLHVHTGDPGRFLFYENWASPEHLERHAASAHLRAFEKIVGELLAEPMCVATYRRIA